MYSVKGNIRMIMTISMPIYALLALIESRHCNKFVVLLKVPLHCLFLYLRISFVNISASVAVCNVMG